MEMVWRFSDADELSSLLSRPAGNGIGGGQSPTGIPHDLAEA
jgi:hypothetical protein